MNKWIIISIVIALSANYNNAQTIEKHNHQHLPDAQKIATDKIEQKLQKSITIKLTKNPKGKHLTLAYALYKILKKSRIHYLREETRKNIPGIEKMKISQVNATEKEAKKLIKLLANSRGLDYVVSERGIYFKKKTYQPKSLSPAFIKTLKEQAAKKEKEELQAKEKNKVYCKHCRAVLKTYRSKQRKACATCIAKIEAQKPKKKKKKVYGSGYKRY